MRSLIASLRNLTLPFGVKSGQRIFLDAVQGFMRVFNDDDQEVVRIGGHDGDIVSLSPFNITSARLHWGALQFGSDADGWLNTGGVELTSIPIGEVTLKSRRGGDSSYNRQANVVLRSGQAGAVTGTATAPRVLLLPDNGTDTVVDQLVSGSVIRCNATGGLETWGAPVMGTGWATGPVSGAYPPLEFRRDASDNLIVYGTFHATTTAPAAIIATGFPSIVGAYVGAAGGAVCIGKASTGFACYVNMQGQFRGTVFPTIAVNDTFMINAAIPLGNLA